MPDRVHRAVSAMPRAEAFQETVYAGARPVTSVSRFTDYLVVGIPTHPTTMNTGSSKHRKALDLSAAGAKVQIIDEDQFVSLLATDPRVRGYTPGGIVPSTR